MWNNKKKNPLVDDENSSLLKDTYSDNLKVPTEEFKDYKDKPEEFTGKAYQSRFGRIKKALQIRGN